jgi:predicted permease
MTNQPQIEVRQSWLEERGTMDTIVVGRLRAGVQAPQAAADLESIAAAIGREHPATDAGLTASLTTPGLFGDQLRAPMKAFSLGLLLLAGLVLLMACVNLAVLLAARGADRRRELAIRLSIGAGRGRIVRQLLTETLLLAAAGGAAGLALAAGVARVLSVWRPPVTLPIEFDVAPDARVFIFALATATIAGLCFGLAPALAASRTDAQAALKNLDTIGPRRRWATRDVLVAAQVALCVVLVASCFLALRGLQSALTMPMGFRPAGITMVGFDLGLAGYSRERGEDFDARARAAVERLPGIQRAAFANTLPLYLDQSNTWVLPDDQPDQPIQQRATASRFEVSPGYFETMGTRLLQGRGIEAADTASTPLVAVVNETFASRVLRTTNAVGRRFRDGGHGWVEVVGVAEDGRYGSLSERPRAAIFEAMTQSYESSVMLVARSTLPTDVVVAGMRQAVASLDPSVALYDTQSLDQMLGVVLLPSRAAAIALGFFGGLALVLALTGLHGIVANAVARRRREIGIRVAIGAQPSAVLRVVLTRTMVLLGLGTAMGFGLVLLAGQVLASIVYQASPRDPVVLGAVAACLLIVGVVACWVPARRSLRISPVQALKAE